MRSFLTLFLGLGLLLAAMACTSERIPAGPGDDLVGPDEDAVVDPGPADIVTEPDYGSVPVSPEDQEFITWYAGLLKEAEDMTTDELFAAFYQERNYVEELSYDPLSADYIDLIEKEMALTSGEKEKLQKQGFAVLDRVRYASHPMGYLDIFVKDLPVLITTDSMLFAVHKSYDTMLRRFEEETLIPSLESMLAKAHEQLFALADASSDPLYADAVADVDLFYTVARSLLSGLPTAPMVAENAARRDELLAQVEALQPELIELFGRAYPCDMPGCAYDFSQFKPRGHYTLSEELERYFRAMIWLGRTELVLTRFHREFVASWLIHKTLVDGGIMGDWEGFDRAIQVFVGESDNLTPTGLGSFLADSAVTGVEMVVEGDPASALMEALEAGGYANQKIMSQIMATDPMSSEPTLLPPIFLFLGQRFVIDSYVFSNVVYDRIVFEGVKQLRYMPSPLDAAFALGFQEALPLLKPELDEWHYAGNLFALRHLVDSHDAAFWGQSMYNVWLDSLRALAVDNSAGELPEAVRTQAYAQKLMHTGLASWAELRHDTILYAKQSYSGVACDYPDGYVEPFPEFFQRLATFAAASRTMLEELPEGGDWGVIMAVDYFNDLETAAGTLAGIAAKELAQEPRTPEETAFIKSLVVEDSMCGSAPFSGWYTDLFFEANDQSFVFDPTIADVHTDPNASEVLHVGTGYANAMVMTVETTCGLKAYVGPVSSYYESIEGNFLRLTDEEWKARFDDETPPRPTWTSSFLVP